MILNRYNHISPLSPLLKSTLYNSSQLLDSVAFIENLENSGCLDGQSGWSGNHFVVEKDNIPLLLCINYEKLHSFGEYIFDWNWADAYHCTGLNYYPKFLSMIPFTPCITDSYLFNQSISEPEKTLAFNFLLSSMESTARAENKSGIHFHFPHFNPERHLSFLKNGFLHRHSIQYHFKNQDFQCFEDFLNSLKKNAKKNIKSERKKLRQEEGLEFVIKCAEEITEADLEFQYVCYLNTINSKRSYAYLTREFFINLKSNSNLLKNLILMQAQLGRQLVASSLFFFNQNQIIGRYWGTTIDLPYLHFELCYYLPLEYALPRGLIEFQAGAQGEHKLSRGFNPTIIHSYHKILNSDFHSAIGQFIEKEKAYLDKLMSKMENQTAYKTI